MNITLTDLLLIIDVQNDFCSGGALAVPDGEQVVPTINQLLPLFQNAVLTQDWHPKGHVSFASSHSGKKPFERVLIPSNAPQEKPILRPSFAILRQAQDKAQDGSQDEVFPSESAPHAEPHPEPVEGWRSIGRLSQISSHHEQILWPDHCVQGSHGAELRKDLNTSTTQLILRKGFHKNIDSYSAFFENDKATPTGLGGYLKERGIRRVFVCGLALDYCVAFSAIDAARLGYETFVIEDACRAIDQNGSLARAKDAMREAGVMFVNAYTIQKV